MVSHKTYKGRSVRKPTIVTQFSIFSFFAFSERPIFSRYFDTKFICVPKHPDGEHGDQTKTGMEMTLTS